MDAGSGGGRKAWCRIPAVVGVFFAHGPTGGALVFRAANGKRAQKTLELLD